jgi:hypothetical protein
MSKQELYVYSLDGLDYRERDPVAKLGWETREEALAAGREQARAIAALKDTPPASVWTGVKVGYVASAFYPDESHLLETLGELAEGEVDNERVDSWPDVDVHRHVDDMDASAAELSAFVKDTLHPFLDQWIEKHGLQPTFWSVSDECKHADDDKAVAVP